MTPRAPAVLDKQIDAAIADLIAVQNKLRRLCGYAENNQRLDDLNEAIKGIKTAIQSLIPF